MMTNRPPLTPKSHLAQRKVLMWGVALLSLSACDATARQAQRNAPRLEKVAQFDHQVTGVGVAENGRIFVNFPRWTEDNALSVAELQPDGSLTPYPSAETNAWRNTKKNKLSARDHWVCVQSVVADGRGSLWVLDPASPAMEGVVKGGAKLVQIDLASDTIKRTIAFDERAAPKSSYLNDVRFSPDGKHAYITDSGRGALLVVDLASGTVRRVLDGHPKLLAEKDVVVRIDGKELRRPDGRAPEFNADGIELSKDGEALYWQALTGKTLYRIPTALLIHPPAKSGALEASIETVGINGVSDGLWLDKQGRMYTSSPEENAIKRRDAASAPGAGAPALWVQDARLRWPDTFSEGPDGQIYFTTSHIQDSPWFKPGADIAVKTELWRVQKD